MLGDTLDHAEQVVLVQLGPDRQVKGNLHLTTQQGNGVYLNWRSSNPASLSANGDVTRPPAGATRVAVTLTASAATGVEQAERLIELVVPPLPEAEEMFGYLMVHFVESDQDGGEQIYYSLSDGDDPLRWTRLNAGRPVLTSRFGTGGVRDPHVVRSPEGDRFYLVATDLHAIQSGWVDATVHGSRHIEVWQSDDLVSWSDQRHVDVMDASAGMTWAPESIHDSATGRYFVHWTSSLYATPDHSDQQFYKIIGATTRDFAHFSPAQVWMDAAEIDGLSEYLLDSTIVEFGGFYYRFVKGVADSVVDEDGNRLGDVFVDRAPSLQTPMNQWQRVATGITYRATSGEQPYEGPLVFRDHNTGAWLMFADHYGPGYKGYVPFTNEDIASDNWHVVDTASTRIPANTKHGVVLPLRGSEWVQLSSAYPA